MASIELRATQMHWLEENDPFADCCVHGGVYIRIGQTLVSDGKDDSWTISTAAFNFLRSIFHDHAMLGEEPLVPHCGFTMWLVESEPDGLYMPNCDLNINWSISHKGDQVHHEFKDGTICETSLVAWKEAVCGFADEVYEYFQTAWPKVINDEMNRDGFELFMRLWRGRRAAADLHDANASDN
jgi:hypothetical protein